MPTALDGHNYRRDADTGLWLREGEAVEPWMDPAGHIRHGDDFADGDARNHAVRSLCQVELHRLLEGLVNYMPLKRVSFGWGKGGALRERVRLIGWCFEELAEPQAAFVSATDRAGIDREGLSGLVSAGYQALSDRDSSPGEVREITAQPLTGEHTQGKNQRPIAKLKELANGLLRQHAVDYFIHGSYASLDPCGYSDLDTLVVLKADVVADPGRLLHAARDLRQALRCLYALDPLQHHGHFVVAEQDLSDYPETFFPLVLFNHAVSLRDDRQGDILGLTVRDCEFETRAAVWGMCYQLRQRYIESRPPCSAYERKLYLSWIMLLPALYLQATGRPCYKRESFELARPEFGDKVWADAVVMASELRSRWSNPRNWRLAMRSMIAVGIDPVLASAGFNKLAGRLGSGNESKAWLEPAARFAEQVLDRMRS